MSDDVYKYEVEYDPHVQVYRVVKRWKWHNMFHSIIGEFATEADAQMWLLMNT